MNRKNLIISMLSISIVVLACTTHASTTKASFLYNLSNFTGTVPFNWVRVSIDAGQNEIYVVSGDTVKVFNSSGMEIYSFGDGLDIGVIYDAAFDGRGNIYLLSYKTGKLFITFCNYRGDPLYEINLKDVPAEFSGLSPNRLLYRDGLLYMISESNMKIVIATADGTFKEGVDLLPLIGFKEDERADSGISGISIDNEGNMLFTVPVKARAYVLSPDKKIRSFGKRGSAPGRFGVPSGIARDTSGNYFVADTLRCVVIVFDTDFKYVSEFGFRGLRPGNLIGPRELSIDRDSKLYVTQLRKRGVSVFKIENTEIVELQTLKGR
jgi:hypothetical protein